MTHPKDVHARYEPRTETLTTGTGHHLRIRDLHRALRTLTGYGLRRLVGRAGISTGVNDPFKSTDEECIRDILDLCRAMPQYALPVIQSGIEVTQNAAFSDLLRNRTFGASRTTAHTRDPNPKSDEKVTAFFFESREQSGAHSYFIRHDRKTTVLRAGQHFSSDRPYAECFTVYRSVQKRYFLRWPEEHRDVPAYYLDASGKFFDFFPTDDDFEELFPGYTYEVFGVQFSLPNLGTDYRSWYDDFETSNSPDPRSDRPLPDDEPDVDRVVQLLTILELDPHDLPSTGELSRHFRRLSVQYHPLKHLKASDNEKLQIEARYLEITNAYNELKNVLAD